MNLFLLIWLMTSCIQADYSVREGATVTLRCTLNTEESGVTWMKTNGENKGILTINGALWTKDRRFSVVDDNDLVLRGVVRSDDGEYECTTRQGRGASAAQITTLTVLLPPGPLKVSHPPAPKPYKEGDDLVITVESSGGNPAPIVQWLKNGNLISSAGTKRPCINFMNCPVPGPSSFQETSTVGDVTTSQLFVTLDHTDDQANYSCVVYNQLTEDAPIVYSVLISVESPDSCNMSCEHGSSCAPGGDACACVDDWVGVACDKCAMTSRYDVSIDTCVAACTRVADTFTCYTGDDIGISGGISAKFYSKSHYEQATSMEQCQRKCTDRSIRFTTMTVLFYKNVSICMCYAGAPGDPGVTVNEGYSSLGWGMCVRQCESAARPLPPAVDYVHCEALRNESNQITCEWSLNDDEEVSEVSGYTLKWGERLSEEYHIVELTNDTHTFVITDLRPSTEYVMTVRAINQRGEGPSNSTQVLTLKQKITVPKSPFEAIMRYRTAFPDAHKFPRVAPPLPVYVGVSLVNILSARINRNEVEVIVHLTLNWCDPGLRWDVIGDDEYNLTDSYMPDAVSLPETVLWTPTVVPARLSRPLERMFSAALSVNSTGHVTLRTAYKTYLNCGLNAAAGNHVCDFRLQSWPLGADMVTLMPVADTMDLSNYFEHSKFKVLNSSMAAGAEGWMNADFTFRKNK